MIRELKREERFNNHSEFLFEEKKIKETYDWRPLQNSWIRIRNK